jgi:sugar/nucleoside kinase (ribokinase family)
VIHGRDSRRAAIEEWGGITYAIAGLDAALADDWETVPVIKVGSDLIQRARQHIATLKRVAPDAALIEVPQPNNRVELRYYDDERRTEVLSGGVPPWEWAGLKTALDTARLDALYVNFLSGWELDLETTRLVRAHFAGPIYCDFHMKAHAVEASGLRVLRPVSNVREWCGCFDYLQANEDEVSMMAADPMALAATALHEGVRALFVTLGSRGSVYFEDGGPAIRTALVPSVRVADAVDPTGCGDVWGATCFARLLAGDNLTDAMARAHAAAARNVQHRGASGLAAHLRGELSLT